MDRLRDASEKHVWISEVANIYPACLIGSRAVAILRVQGAQLVSLPERLVIGQKDHQTMRAFRFLQSMNQTVLVGNTIQPPETSLYAPTLAPVHR